MMTAGQIRKAATLAMQNNKYLGLRWDDNTLTGCNPKAVLLGMKEREYWEKTKIQSYQLISLNEYIRTKIKYK